MRVPVRQPRPHRALRTRSLSLEVFGLFFLFFSVFFFFVSFSPLFCRVNVSGMKFGWDAKGKCLSNTFKLPERKLRAQKHGNSLRAWAGAEGIQKGPKHTFCRLKSSNIQEKKCQVVHRDPKHLLFTNQHKTNKKAGWFKISFRF